MHVVVNLVYERRHLLQFIIRNCAIIASAGDAAYATSPCDCTRERKLTMRFFAGRRHDCYPFPHGDYGTSRFKGSYTQITFLSLAGQ